MYVYRVYICILFRLLPKREKSIEKKKKKNGKDTMRVVLVTSALFSSMILIRLKNILIVEAVA